MRVTLVKQVLHYEIKLLKTGRNVLIYNGFRELWREETEDKKKEKKRDL